MVPLQLPLDLAKPLDQQNQCYIMYSCPLPSNGVCNKLYMTKILGKHQVPRQYLPPLGYLQQPLQHM